MTDRLEAFLHALDRTSMADLEVLVLPEPDPDARGALLARVAAAEKSAADGRASVDDTRDHIRELMLQRLSSSGYRPTWAGLNWTGSIRYEERARLIVAVEDAAVAALLDDRLDPEDIAALREPFEIATSMTGTGITGAPNLSGPAAPLTALAIGAGTGGLGFIGLLAMFLRRRRKRLEERD